MLRPRQERALRTASALVALACFARLTAAQGVYVETDAFLQAAFSGGEPVAQTLWITSELRGPIESILGHSFGALRVRYWRLGDRTAWVLNEIGKERPITIGVVIDGGAIESVRVLEFRESRGWEVRYPFFTDQFGGARLKVDERGGSTLDRQIDGITGATLSVRAVTRVSQVALYLSGHVKSS